MHKPEELWELEQTWSAALDMSMHIEHRPLSCMQDGWWYVLSSRHAQFRASRPCMYMRLDGSKLIRASVYMPEVLREHGQAWDVAQGESMPFYVH